MLPPPPEASSYSSQGDDILELPDKIISIVGYNCSATASYL